MTPGIRLPIVAAALLLAGAATSYVTPAGAAVPGPEPPAPRWVPLPAPVPMPEAEPQVPGPVPMPRVHLRGPLPVPMPEARVGEELVPPLGPTEWRRARTPPRPGAGR